MRLELLYRIEYVCRIPKGFWSEQALTQLAVKILLDDSLVLMQWDEQLFCQISRNNWYCIWLSCKPNIYVSWSTSELRVMLAPWNRFKPFSKIFLLIVPRPYFFCGSFMFFCLVFAMPLCVSVYLCLVVTCWVRADILALVCDVWYVFVTFPCGILGQVWYLIVSIPDLCSLSYSG